MRKSILFAALAATLGLSGLAEAHDRRHDDGYGYAPVAGPGRGPYRPGGGGGGYWGAPVGPHRFHSPYVWVPGRWVWSSNRWTWLEGHWAYRGR